MAAIPDPLRSAEIYWDSAAETYEQDFSGTIVGKFRRSVVLEVLHRTFQPGQRVLELSCGTGIDAISLAHRGVNVVACDLSPRMIELARAQAAKENLASPPDFRVLPTEDLLSLRGDLSFDGAFSNFSGLNCVEDLTKVAEDLGTLLKPGARLVLCMMGRFVPLEILWFLAARKPERAFRRLLDRKAPPRSTAGPIVRRPTISQIERHMRPAFRLLQWKGIGIVVPPSYAEHVAARMPRTIHRLAGIDRQIGPLRIFRNMADCVLMEFERLPTHSNDDVSR